MPRASKAAGSSAAKSKAGAPAKKAAAKATKAAKPAKTSAKQAKAAPKKAAGAKKVAPLKKAVAKKGAAKVAPPKKAATVKAAAPAKAAPAKKDGRPPAKAAPAPTRPPAKTPPKQLGALANKTAAPKKAAAPPPPVKKALKAADLKFFAEMKDLLLKERDEYEQQAEAFRAEAEQLAADMEPGDSQFDEETGGEGDTMSIERERDLALSAQARAAVDEIDRALAKIQAGTYGICERCHQPIMRARLKALPYAALCVACKSGGLSRR